MDRRPERTPTTFATSREIAATPEEIFAAFLDPERLARWWGPAGFTNTFARCELRTGGSWSYTMHGPDGRDYPNESELAEIDAPRRFVVQHVSQPRYRLTIELTPSPGGTTVSWTQTFESPVIAERLGAVVVPANEQNLDRLAAEVARETGVRSA